MLRRARRPRNPFESRTEVWRQVGLGSEIDHASAQRARGGAIVLGVLIAAVLIAFAHRKDLFPGGGDAIRAITVIALVVLGTALARQLGRSFVPALMRRLDPAVAGTVGFSIRLLTVVVMFIVAARIAGLDAGTLAVGGAFTAVVVGLAAQQTLGNLFAGVVLLSNRPFRVGERVRLVGGIVAGSVEGTVSSLGLFYTTLVSGADRTMIPNSSVLQLAIVPLREPNRIEMKARFSAETTPSDIERRLREAVSVPLRYPPDIRLEELDRDEVVVGITATPLEPDDGAELAGQILDAVRERGGVEGNGHPG
ncbi:MAG: mechanosensitive ion channel family protein [Solirubrobacterales bacterium]